MFAAKGNEIDTLESSKKEINTILITEGMRIINGFVNRLIMTNIVIDKKNHMILSKAKQPILIL